MLDRFRHLLRDIARGLSSLSAPKPGEITESLKRQQEAAAEPPKPVSACRPS